MKQPIADFPNFPARRLPPSDLGPVVDPERFSFTSTADLTPPENIVGQPRALKALELGLGIQHPRYNIYVAGAVDYEHREMIHTTLQERVKEQATPSDWVYVNNFSEPENPLAIPLRPGQGTRLRRDMDQFIDRLVREFPKTFRDKNFRDEKRKLELVFDQHQRDILQEIEMIAREKNLLLQRRPDGNFVFTPLTAEGHAMTYEDVKKLSDADMAKLNDDQDEVIEKVRPLFIKLQQQEWKFAETTHELERDYAGRIIKPMVTDIAAGYQNDKVDRWLDQVMDHIVHHLDQFQEQHIKSHVDTLMGTATPSLRGDESFHPYMVNVLVDNSAQKGPPVVVEDKPNYKNLFGAIDRVVDRFGKLVTNFTRIKAGSILKANGGYLVVDMMDILTEPMVWKELKQTIKAGAMEISTFDPYSIFTISAMRPEAIPLQFKLVGLGSHLIYRLLYLYDEDFKDVFKVKAEFTDRTDLSQEAGHFYGRFVKKLSDKEGVLPFSRQAVGELVWLGSRLAEDKDKVTVDFSVLAEFIREADFWAKKAGSTAVEPEHIRAAMAERIYRSDAIAERIREMISHGTILINLEGTVTGQINALTVADLGDFSFGWPARVTATVAIGQSGLISIERESHMSGHSFDKGVLILEGYMRHQYGQEHPLALSASLAMEQSYGHVDGDSATMAELLCLLSSLAGLPLRQDLAVTGSLNQHGAVQAIGGVQEKIEGFFDLCKMNGLTGTQGVCIPEANVRHLVLRPDIVAAVQEEKFHLWSVSHLHQAIELFMGVPAGSIDDPKTVHGRVNQRLIAMMEKMRASTTPRDGVVTRVEVPTPPVDGRPNPEPPFPRGK